MRIIFLILLAMGLVYYLAFEPRRNRPGHRYRVNSLMTGLILIAIIPTAFFEVRWLNVENSGAQIVKEVSGKELAKLKCQRLSATFVDTKLSYAGWVNFAKPDVANLKFKQCQELRKFFKNPNEATPEEIASYMVLLHEAQHVKGEINEGITECRAQSSYPQYAQNLGVSKENSYLQVQLYRSTYYQFMPEQYQDYECMSQVIMQQDIERGK